MTIAHASLHLHSSVHLTLRSVHKKFKIKHTTQSPFQSYAASISDTQNDWWQFLFKPWLPLAAFLHVKFWSLSLSLSLSLSHLIFETPDAAATDGMPDVIEVSCIPWGQTVLVAPQNHHWACRKEICCWSVKLPKITTTTLDKKNPINHEWRTLFDHVLSCSITSEQGGAKSSVLYTTLCPTLIARDRAWYHTIESHFIHRSRIFVQGSRTWTER